MNFRNYIQEQLDIKQIKKEIDKLRWYKDKKKLNPQGQKRLEKLEDMLFKMGIFDY